LPFTHQEIAMSSSLPMGDPEALGFDAQRLARIGPAMQHYIDARKVPNLVTLLARRGEIVHLEARGVLDLESGEPVDTSTLFRLYSNTKPIAGLATLILYEDGLLTPDDPVGRFLPEWSNLRVLLPDQPGASERARRGITVRDCLTNTTGLATPARAPIALRAQHRDTLEKLGWFGRPPADLPFRERVRLMAELPLLAHPGQRFDYHVGYMLLGCVLEAASGMPLDRLFHERIFAPLGMHDTGFYLADGALPRFPAQYVPRQVDGQWVLQRNEKASESEKYHGPKTRFGAGGDAQGVLSTVGDYARFGQMLLNGGVLDGVRIIGRKTVELMTGNHTGDMVIPMTGPGFHWGLGVSTYHGRGRPPLIRSVGTYGWGGAAGTTYFADPAESLLGVCFTQVLQHALMPGNHYQEEFQRLAYQALAG
jgi:CubicO group peptidase (beta-lactamase class C family)